MLNSIALRQKWNKYSNSSLQVTWVPRMHPHFVSISEIEYLVEISSREAVVK